MQGMVGRISEGNLTQNVEIRSANEIGVLADSLNVAQGGISGLVSHVGETSEHLNLAEQQFVDNFSIMNEAIENLTNAMGDVAQNISQRGRVYNGCSRKRRKDRTEYPEHHSGYRGFI